VAQLQKVPRFPSSIDARLLWQTNNIKPFNGNQFRIQKNDSILLTLVAKGKPLAIDTFVNCPPLGRFLLRQGSDVVGGGIVVDTEFGGEEEENFWNHVTR